MSEMEMVAFFGSDPIYVLCLIPFFVLFVLIILFSIGKKR